MKTVIITRYNIKPRPDLTLPPEERPPEPVNLDVDWLLHRRELFLNYCLPSVAAQTRQDFTWYLLFDAETPKDLMPFTSADKYANITPVFTEYSDEAILEVQRQVSSGDDGGLLSIRLDNDDTLANAYIEKMATYADATLPSLSSAPSQALLHFSHGIHNHLQVGRSYLKYYPRNPFCALVETRRENTPFATVMQCAVGQIYKTVAKRILITDADTPMWMMNVHGRNIANSVLHTKGIDLDKPLDPEALADFTISDRG